MADKIVLADASILIEYFRKTEKTNSAFVKLFVQGFDFCISAITEYEIYSGANLAQLPFWEEVLLKTNVLAFDKSVVRIVVDINNNLKRKRKQFHLADFFIGTTAIANNLPFATLNKKHFDNIDRLKMIA